MQPYFYKKPTDARHTTNHKSIKSVLHWISQLDLQNGGPYRVLSLLDTH